jgi:phosphinothricin acetyltransferase
MSFEIRPGRAADLESIAAIYNHYVEHSSVTFDVDSVRTADRESWLHEHSGGGRYRLLVATDEGRLVGWSTTSPFRPRAAYGTTVESSVYCSPRDVGRRIGTQLYAALFDAIADEDIERVVAGVTAPNPASVRLHRRFGFRRVGTFHRVGRKFGRYWDVVWFERPLRLTEASPANVARSEARSGARGDPRPAPRPASPGPTRVV